MNTEQTTLTEDELLSIQVLPLKLILAAANGQIDLNEMARNQLINRGLDLSGKWVGFQKARELLHR
ncbi:MULTISPECIES: hypothetical protein [Nitrosomonas]|uniref:Uncharacterized protein n=1 Tax=Nitrosomonas communis TaxID=44574 RepID=A0A0F7KBF3_9PROT|nr:MULTISPECIES: hypothetical protein [Nitrosomonas]AKH36906.1 hypothetical protein AAW31_02355 [Nitrosomonas communis]TYP86628.1 hypothetical protein BCL69_10307 [Nitrosomonas communis]UVS62020.1 hypothetical protein NX761_02490 [Nitrosomonas sp. PLL12]